MVNTGDILKAEKAVESAKAGLASGDEKLDDVMLAMDVVDTLRHERLMVEKELAGEERRGALVERLREIYKAQGINVPDEVLMDGVLALEEQRFAYEPPKNNFSTKLARIYINRRKWLPLVFTLAAVIFGAWAINHLAFERPARLEAKRVETLLNDKLPADIEGAYNSAASVAATPELKSRAEDLRNLALDAIKSKNVQAAETHTQDLNDLAQELSQIYTVRIVYRDGRDSGFIRHNDLGGNDVYNYYLIVEGITPSGELANVTITSEEDQKSRKTKTWAVRVPKAVFDRIGDDKRDDRIIQKADIGTKRRGYLDPEYSVEIDGGAILDW